MFAAIAHPVCIQLINKSIGYEWFIVFAEKKTRPITHFVLELELIALVLRRRIMCWFGDIQAYTFMTLSTHLIINKTDAGTPSNPRPP